MESVRNGYLLVLSAWMVCAVSAQLTDPAWKNPVDDFSAQRLDLPFLSTVFTLAFFLIMYAIYRRVARNRRRRAGGHARPVLSAVVSMPKRDSGVERSVIDALPVFEFASLQGLKEGLECVVCLSRFEGSQVLRLLPKCRHAFHVVCVDRWLEYNSTCPICRQKVEADDVFKVYRHDNVEEAEGFQDSAPHLVQAFVQRENVDNVEREPEPCRVPAGSFQLPSMDWEMRKNGFIFAQKSMQSLATTGNANDKGMEQTIE